MGASAMNRMNPAGGPTTGFRHEVLLHSSREQLLAGVVPYVREALDRDETVLMVVSGDSADLLRAAIGPDAARLDWADSAGWYRRLGPMFEDFRSYLAEQSARGQPSRVVAEQGISAPSTTWLREYLSFESMTNIVYAPYRIPVLCLWDRNRVAPDIADRVTAAHPYLLEGNQTVVNARFLDPVDFLGRARHPELAAPQHVEFTVRLQDAGDLGAARLRLHEHAVRNGFPAERASELVIAANEITTNALEHGRHPVWLAVWRTGEYLVCECSDGGSGFADPTVGFRRPERPTGRGCGLWLARQLADLVQIRSRRSGSQIRLSFALPTVSGRSSG